MMKAMATTVPDRRLRADAERNRARLLDAAAQAFAEHGTEVSIAEIARRAGVGQGTVFRHFASKEALITAIVMDRMGTMRALAQSLLDEPPEQDAVVAFMRGMAALMSEDRALVEAVGISVLEDPAVRAVHHEVVAALDALVRRGQDEGEIRPDVSALDVMLLSKAVSAASADVCEILPTGGWDRFVDLARDALSPQGARPLSPGASMAELERALDAAS